MSTLAIGNPLTDRSGSQELGRAIQVRRAELGMKRKELATSSGLSYPYVSEIENGHKDPSSRALRKLAEALELPAAHLLELAGRIGDESHDGSVLLESEISDRSHRSVQTERAFLAMATPPWPQPESGSGSFDRWLEGLVRHVVRDELRAWARTELRDVLRSELGQLAEEHETE